MSLLSMFAGVSTIFGRTVDSELAVPPRGDHGSRVSTLRATDINLVLVAKRRRGHWDDFREIARRIHRQAPDIHVSVVGDRYYNAWRPHLFFRPTWTVSPLALRRLRPLRGTVTQNTFLKKSEEYAVLESAGLPIPKWALLTQQSRPDISRFGDYVVTKPDCGGRGAEVKIKRRSRVRWSLPRNERSRSLGEDGMIVQQFIYTGPWPASYRVTTLFGKVLFAWKVTAASSRRPLLGPDRFREGAEGGGMSIVSSGHGCTFELTREPDVLALAARAHAAFPDHPLLGFDMVREVPSGRLYIIEANSCGQLWHFSSETGLSIQRDNGIDFASQFQGLDVAAQALIEQARRRAA